MDESDPAGAAIGRCWGCAARGLRGRRQSSERMRDDGIGTPMGKVFLGCVGLSWRRMPVMHGADLLRCGASYDGGLGLSRLMDSGGRPLPAAQADQAQQALRGLAAPHPPRADRAGYRRSMVYEGEVGGL